MSQLAALFELLRRHGALAGVCSVLTLIGAGWVASVEQMKPVVNELRTSHSYDREQLERVEHKIDLIIRRFGLAIEPDEECDEFEPSTLASVPLPFPMEQP